ncbi:MAG TPA: ABC transporter permease [Terriglobales bacterium]|jgi:predicted permease|nr:ABC transporter permease [Terriglobales bacterium]
MNPLRTWVLRLAGIFSKERRERDFASEIEAHLQMHIDDNIRAGLSPEEARRQAIVKLGGVEQTKQVYRERGTAPLLESFLQDLRFAARQLVKNPGFACIAVFVLALGIGASLAIFAFVDATLIRPLPYWKPNRLVNATESVAVFPRANLSYPDYLDWKSRNDVFSSLDVWDQRGYMLSTPSGVQLVRGSRVSDGFFRTLGVIPLLGRDFYGGEDLPSAPHTVMLSYEAWQKWLGGREDVIGQPVTLSGDAYTIVGVLPASFQFARSGSSEFWTTLHANGHCDIRRSCHSLTGIARLKDGVSVGKANAEMKAIAAQLEKQYPDSNRGQGAIVEPLSDVFVGEVRPILLVLMAGAALLLVIACVNVSSLLLVRSESRRREIAVRGALGASQARLIRQFVTEGLVLVVAAVCAGLGLGAMFIRILLSFITKDVMAYTPYFNGLGLNLHSLLFAGGLSLLSLGLFSLAPGLRFTLWNDLRGDLAEGGRTAASSLWRKFASNLVIVELAMAVVLLAAAGLLGKSLYRLLHVDIGFRPDHLATAQVVLPADYTKDEQRVAITRQVISRLAVLPSVKSVGATSRLPVSSNGNTTWIRFPGRPYSGEHNEVNEREVSSEFFKTLQANLLSGRYFTDAEDLSKPKVVIINRALAEQYFPGEDPIGKQIGDTELSPKSLEEIVGVVDDVKEGSLEEKTWPALYEPLNQSPDDFLTVLVRTDQAEQSLLPAMVATIHQVNAGLAVFDEASMNERIYNSPSAYLHRTSAWLIGGFAVLALLLGAVGLYGVIAYSVSQRTREIGVRMALGAQRSAVYQLIMSEAGWLTGIGILAGLICAVAAGLLMRKLLFSVPAWDASTLVVVSGVLAVCALLATYVPARRAASVNPVDALRAE